MKNHPTLAKDIMVTRLVTFSPDVDVYEAIGLLLKHKISGAPVIDDAGNYLGVFSEHCSMSMIVKGAYEQLPTNAIGPFLDRDSHTITEETDLLTIAQIFQQTGSRRLPVLRDGKLVGQISRRDVLRAAHNMMTVARNNEAPLLYLSSLMERSEAPIAQ